jgi:hypothetical protein
MSAFDNFIDEVVSGARKLAEKSLAEAAAEQDARTFLTSVQDKLKRWTAALQSGELLKDEFEVLVKSQTDLVALAALTQAGIAAKRLEEFRDGLIDLVIKAGLRVFL